VTPGEVRRAAGGAAAIRAVFGVISLAAPGPASRLFGFPAEHDSATARVIARMFGVRELALAALVWGAPEENDRLRRVLTLNAAVDAGDAAVFAGAVAARSGVDRPALSGLVPALAGCAIWLALARNL
jgi:hypothetical protein